MADIKGVGGASAATGVKKSEGDEVSSGELQGNNRAGFDSAGKEVKNIRQESTGDILRRNGLDSSDAPN